MIEVLCDMLQKAGAPPWEFWEHELELAVERTAKKVTQDGFVDKWIADQPKRLQNLLKHQVLFGRQRLLTARLPTHVWLLPYLLVQDFARFKSKSAVIELAQRVLSENTLALCAKTNGEPDPLCIYFALYEQDPQSLVSLLCVDKIHKMGFARMRLLQNVRRPRQPLAEFLTEARVAEILSACDAQWADGRTSELKRICGPASKPGRT